MVSARSFGDLFFIQSDERDKRIVENWIFDKYSDIQTEESLEHGFYFTPHLVRDEESKKHAISFLNRLYKAENTNDIHRPIIIGFSDHESDECASFWIALPGIENSCEVMRVKDLSDDKVLFVPTKVSINVILKKDEKGKLHFKMRFANIIKIDDNRSIHLPFGKEVGWMPLELNDGGTNHLLIILTLGRTYQETIKSIFHDIGKHDPVLKLNGITYNSDFQEQYRELQLNSQFSNNKAQYEKKIQKLYSTRHANWNKFAKNFNVYPESIAMIPTTIDMVIGEGRDWFFKKYTC